MKGSKACVKEGVRDEGLSVGWRAAQRMEGWKLCVVGWNVGVEWRCGGGRVCWDASM